MVQKTELLLGTRHAGQIRQQALRGGSLAAHEKIYRFSFFGRWLETHDLRQRRGRNRAMPQIRSNRHSTLQGQNKPCLLSIADHPVPVELILIHDDEFGNVLPPQQPLPVMMKHQVAAQVKKLNLGRKHAYCAPQERNGVGVRPEKRVAHLSAMKVRIK